MGIISLKKRLVHILRWSERYTKTDMVYFASGNFWLITSRVIGVGSGVLLTIAFANLISPTAFGTYKYILSIAGIIGAFSLTGLNHAVMRAVAQGNTSVIHVAFRINMMWSVPASLLALMGGIYYFVQGNVILATGLALIALTNPFLNSFIFSKSLLIGLQKFKVNALYNVPRSLIPVSSLIIVLFLSENIILIILTYFLSNLIAGIITYKLAVNKYAKKSDQSVENIALTNEVVTYGKHLSVVGIITQIAGYIDQFLLWHFVGPIQLAIYIFALAPVREIKNFSENFFPLIFPKFAVKTRESIKEVMPLRLKQVFIFSAIMAGLYILAAPLIFRVFFPQYLSSVLGSQLLALAIILQPKGLIDVFITAHGRVKERYVYTITTSVSRIILLAILIPLYGFMGAIFATITAEIISAMVLLILYRRM